VIWQDLDEVWQQRRIEYLTTLLNKYSAKGADYEATYLSG